MITGNDAKPCCNNPGAYVEGPNTTACAVVHTEFCVETFMCRCRTAWQPKLQPAKASFDAECHLGLQMRLELKLAGTQLLRRKNRQGPGPGRVSTLGCGCGFLKCNLPIPPHFLLQPASHQHSVTAHWLLAYPRSYSVCCSLLNAARTTSARSVLQKNEPKVWFAWRSGRRDGEVGASRHDGH